MDREHGFQRGPHCRGCPNLFHFQMARAFSCSLSTEREVQEPPFSAIPLFRCTCPTLRRVYSICSRSHTSELPSSPIYSASKPVSSFAFRRYLLTSVLIVTCKVLNQFSWVGLLIHPLENAIMQPLQLQQSTVVHISVFLMPKNKMTGVEQNISMCTIAS
jgi:hypothetical protein